MDEPRKSSVDDPARKAYRQIVGITFMAIVFFGTIGSGVLEKVALPGIASGSLVNVLVLGSSAAFAVAFVSGKRLTWTVMLGLTAFMTVSFLRLAINRGTRADMLHVFSWLMIFLLTVYVPRVSKRERPSRASKHL